MQYPYVNLGLFPNQLQTLQVSAQMSTSFMRLIVYMLFYLISPPLQIQTMSLDGRDGRNIIHFSKIGGKCSGIYFFFLFMAFVFSFGFSIFIVNSMLTF